MVLIRLRDKRIQRWGRALDRRDNIGPACLAWAPALLGEQSKRRNRPSLLVAPGRKGAPSLAAKHLIASSFLRERKVTGAGRPNIKKARTHLIETDRGLLLGFRDRAAVL